MAGTGFLKAATGVLMILMVSGVSQAASRVRVYTCSDGTTFVLQLNEQANGTPGRTASLALPGSPGSVLMLDPTQDGLVYENKEFRVTVFNYGAVHLGEMSRGRVVAKHTCSSM